MCGRKATQSQLFCRLRNFWAPLWLRGYHPTPKAFAIPNAEGVRCPPTPKVFAVPQRRRCSLPPNAEGVRCPPTPKAFAVPQRRRRSLMPAQGWSASDNPGSTEMKMGNNPERVPLVANPFRVDSDLGDDPRVLATLEPWAGIGERLRR